MKKLRRMVDLTYTWVERFRVVEKWAIYSVNPHHVAFSQRQEVSEDPNEESWKPSEETAKEGTNTIRLLQGTLQVCELYVHKGGEWKSLSVSTFRRARATSILWKLLRIVWERKVKLVNVLVESWRSLCPRKRMPVLDLCHQEDGNRPSHGYSGPHKYILKAG